MRSRVDGPGAQHLLQDAVIGQCRKQHRTHAVAREIEGEARADRDVAGNDDG